MFTHVSARPNESNFIKAYFSGVVINFRCVFNTPMCMDVLLLKTFNQGLSHAWRRLAKATQPKLTTRPRVQKNGSICVQVPVDIKTFTGRANKIHFNPGRSKPLDCDLYGGMFTNVTVFDKMYSFGIGAFKYLSLNANCFLQRSVTPMSWFCAKVVFQNIQHDNYCYSETKFEVYTCNFVFLCW